MLKQRYLMIMGAAVLLVSLFFSIAAMPAEAYSASPPVPGSISSAQPTNDWSAHSMLRVHRAATSGPTGLSPAQIRAAYNLPSTGGTGTIAIIDAYDDPTVQNDLYVFSQQFGLPLPDSTNFEKHMMASRISTNGGWALEISLDVQWAHAIAPNAKILLVEAKSASLTDLLAAVDYARKRSDVVAISMSWGASEFSSESAYDSYFTSSYGATFFASSGDNGKGVIWPSVSPNVVAVGGTTLTFSGDSLVSETAWSGSGGGVSKYEAEPSYQTTYGVSGTNGKRAVPDVSYDADPYSGVSVYDSTPYGGAKGWWQVGGTSAGAPQWAAIQSLGLSVSNSNLYQDALASCPSYFRDIISGSNGYSAGPGYDLVTGLGSPLTTSYAPVTTPDFSISASPSSITANRGASPTSTITVTSLSGFSDVVNLATSVPAGWDASLSLASVTPSAGGSASSTLTVNVPSDTAAGTYSVTITGTTSGSLTHSTSLTVTVVVPDFSIKASPSARTISRTGSTTYTVTLTAINGYNSAVSLSVTGLPGSATASFSPSAVTPTPTGASSTLKVTINQRQRGTYTLTITATDGALSHSTSVTLTNR
jgi:subtilase family serine protease